MLRTTTDAGITTNLAEAVQQLLPTLEQFMQYADHDLAVSEYTLWRESLTEPLPQQGAGAPRSR